MPELQSQRGGAAHPGGIVGYPLERLYEEVAFIAYYFHWDHAAIMSMPHADRRLWCEHISGINQRLMHEHGA